MANGMNALNQNHWVIKNAVNQLQGAYVRDLKFAPVEPGKALGCEAMNCPVREKQTTNIGKRS